jgi:cell division protein FtsB
MKIGRWILFAAVLAFLYFLFAGDDGVVALFGSHREVRRMEREIETLNDTIDSLRTEIVRLREDTLYIERIAREKLGMARTDEKVYKFIDTDGKNKGER